MDKFILHKFHKLNFHLVELLTTNSFYCAAPKKLNDPYDCFVNLTMPAIEHFIFSKKYKDVDISDIIEKHRLSHPWETDDDGNPIKQVDFRVNDEGLAMELFADQENKAIL
ncbi:MAG: hypothetical protein IPP71_19850 [Bacteroidetes bacterium]|nr:hypothetical protein [Bacteroidota bacterium]